MKKNVIGGSIAMIITGIVIALLIITVGNLMKSSSPVSSEKNNLEIVKLPVTIQNVDSSNNLIRLMGGEIEIINRETEEVIYKAFDDTGVVSVELQEGNYSVKEVSPPEDYYDNNIFTALSITKEDISNNKGKTIVLENNSKTTSLIAKEMGLSNPVEENMNIIDDEPQSEDPIPETLKAEVQENKLLVNEVKRENPQTSDNLFLKEIMIVMSSTICLGLFILYSHLIKLK